MSTLSPSILNNHPSQTTFIIDESLNVLETFPYFYGHYRIPSSRSTWLASVTRINENFFPTLLEKQYEDEPIYKKSSLLPAMVFQEEFLKKATEKVRSIYQKTLEKKNY